MVFLLMLGTFACGKKSDTVFLEKDGKLYEVADQVSFYYPRQFEYDINNENKQMVRFIKGQEIISYTMIVDDTDNLIEDLPELYEGQLEEDGATDVRYKDVEIASGLKCQEFSGQILATGIKFKNVVYFTDKATYILSYHAPQNVYDEGIDNISEYLHSLAVHSE